MSAVVQLSSEVEVQQTGGVHRQYLKAEWVLVDRLQTQLVGSWNLVILIEGLGPNAKDMDVVFGHQQVEHILLTHLLTLHCP